jgi:hypothetical protein
VQAKTILGHTASEAGVELAFGTLSCVDENMARNLNNAAYLGIVGLGVYIGKLGLHARRAILLSICHVILAPVSLGLIGPALAPEHLAES